MSGIDTAVDAAYNAGFRDANLVTAVAIAGAESSYDASQFTHQIPGNKVEDSVGLWQISLVYHPEYDKETLKDPRANADAAYKLSSGGSNWHPWSTYPVLYLAFVPVAKIAVANYMQRINASGTGTSGGSSGGGITPVNPIDPNSGVSIIPLPANSPAIDPQSKAASLACSNCSFLKTTFLPNNPIPVISSNIPACIACLADYLTKGLISIGINVGFILLVFLGLYLLFRPEIHEQINKAVDNVKNGVKTVAEVSV